MEGLRRAHPDLANQALAFSRGITSRPGLLALALLVTWVTANDHHTSVTTDDSAAVTNLFTLGFTFIIFLTYSDK